MKGGELGNSPPVWTTLQLGGSACYNPVCGRGVDIEGPDNGGSVQEVREHLADLGILFLAVAFGFLFGIPEAERQNSILLAVRHENGFVHESGLFLQDGQDLVVDGSAKLTSFSGFGG